jgi:hypothetical protein
LQAARDAEPRGKRFKRRIVSLVRSKGERRREREYYDARFVVSHTETRPEGTGPIRRVFASSVLPQSGGRT